MEMTDEEVSNLLDYLDENGLDATAEAFGMTPEEIMNIYPAMELMDSKEEDKGIDLSMPEDGKFESLSDEQIANIQNFIPAGRVGNVLKAGKGMFSDAMNKLFASKGLKAAQQANRGSTGEVVKGTARKLKDSNLRPAIAQKTADRYSSMADRVKAQNATKVGAGATGAAIVAGAIDNAMDDGEIVTGHPPVNNPYEEPKTQKRSLKGNRDANGNLMTVDADRERYAKEGKLIFTHANGSYAFAEPGSDMADELMAKEYFPGDIAAQNAGKSQSNTGSNWADAQSEDEVLKADDSKETMGNQFGYHKRKGQNFWTVNNDDPYWDTHVMGTGDAWSDADVKRPTKELNIDWSSWF